MDNRWKNIKLDMDFIKADDDVLKKHIGEYKVIISDDDPEVHTVTKMVLKDFEFEGYRLSFIDTYSGEDTRTALRDNPDTAILFQDVVMEENDTGLQLVKYLRETLKNRNTRIVLRTGQPGQAPEDKIIRDYDINDYRLKTELTVSRLYTTLYSALRNYRDIARLDKHGKGLEKIIKASADLFANKSMSGFLTGVLEQLAGFYYEDIELMYIRKSGEHPVKNGFVTVNKCNAPSIAAATGKYVEHIGKRLSEVEELKEIACHMNLKDSTINDIEFIGNGFLIRNKNKRHQNNYIYIEGKKEIYDLRLIELFLSNYSVAFDNYILNNMIFSTQKEIIVTLGEIIENHFDETGSHVKRVSSMMHKFAAILGLPESECEKLRVASTLHDIGKIAVPDSVIKKPGRLTPEEFEMIKEHTVVGYRILAKSHLEILRVAADIALNHHEKEDGTGYPYGLKGGSIPLYAQMLAIVDVYDAMTRKRVYKDAASLEETLEYIAEQKGKHFNEMLADVFLVNHDKITQDED